MTAYFDYEGWYSFLGQKNLVAHLNLIRHRCKTIKINAPPCGPRAVSPTQPEPTRRTRPLHSSPTSEAVQPAIVIPVWITPGECSSTELLRSVIRLAFRAAGVE